MIDSLINTSVKPKKHPLIEKINVDDINIFDRSNKQSCIQHLQLSKDQGADLIIAFEAIDTDNSGFITPHKLKLTMKKVGINADEKKISDLMLAADKDKDGKIDFYEYINAVINKQL